MSGTDLPTIQFIARLLVEDLLARLPSAVERERGVRQEQSVRIFLVRVGSLGTSTAMPRPGELPT
jgi:hypothetical protein